MTLPGQRLTYEEYRRLPDDQRYELMEGELVMTPAPTSRHQRILVRLSSSLDLFTYERGLGVVLVAPTDVVLSTHTVLQPDLLFVASGRTSIIDPQGAVHGAPDLVVEILSPSTAQRDLQIKRQLYSQYGVREYWIVDPDARLVEVLTHQGSGLDTWQRFTSDAVLTSTVIPGLKVKLAEIMPE